MPSNLIKSTWARIKSFNPPAAVKRFIAHNGKVFSRQVPPTAPQSRLPVVLMELNEMHSAHIAYSYLANVLAGQDGTQIVGYFPRALTGMRERLSFAIRKFFKLDTFGVYASFGATEFLMIAPSAAHKKRARQLLPEILRGFNSKSDVESLTINGVWIGDLVYDTYLMRFRRPTIDWHENEFQQFLLESIELFVFWEDYIDQHDVRGINVSHCVYNLAMPLRLAAQRNIPVFQANATHVYRPHSGNLFAYNDFVYFRERFAALPEAVRKAGLAEARQRIERRFAGEVGVDMHYSTRSAYGAARHARLIRESPRTKILIATHCFFDSPHSYGNNLFPDFHEWLDFLGRMSETTDYDWYIKTHPDYLPGTMEIIKGFIARYPKLTLVPSDASHHQLIAEGIDVALTVYGTIAFEYAALGVPVINCSLNNPHIAYDFNLHPSSVEAYRELLLHLDELAFSIDREQVHEYYFMRHIYNTEDLFFDDYQAAIEAVGGYAGQFTPAIYDRWLKEWTPVRHAALLSALQTYISSGDFRMEHQHKGRKFAFEPSETPA